MSEERKKATREVFDALQEKMSKKTPCDACDSKNKEIMHELTTLPALNMPDSIEWQMPAAMVQCKGCGKIEFFGLNHLGLDVNYLRKVFTSS